MDISQVKKYLNRQVSYKGSLYNLVGCIIRRSTKENKFIYQAKLQDSLATNSLVVCKLDDVEIRSNNNGN